MKAISEQNGFRFGIVVWPLPLPFDRYPFSEEHAQVRELCSRLNIPALDLLQEFRAAHANGPELDVGDGHPNAAGHRLGALAIDRWLQTLGWLEIAKRSSVDPSAR